MNAPSQRRRVLLRGGPCGATSSPALQCGRNVYRAINRRMPEAAALAGWLAENAAAFGLSESAVPDEASGRSRRRAVTATQWTTAVRALECAASSQPAGGRGGIDCWVASLRRRLALDALDARILALALHYRLDRRVEGLCDAISECRGRPTRFMRDAGLIALLLAAPEAGIANRLASEARLLASGALHLGRCANLSVPERLMWLIRRDVMPSADIYDQLLGTTTNPPLDWASFAHLGREVDVAAELLRAALARREGGVNVLLYGPPGTGKTAFAATLAARVGARLRPVAEADNDGDGPNRVEIASWTERNRNHVPDCSPSYSALVSPHPC